MFRRKLLYLCDIIITPTTHRDDPSVLEKHRGDDVVDVAVIPREKPGSKQVYLRGLKDKPCEIYEVRSNLSADDIRKYLKTHRFTAEHISPHTGFYETLVCVDRDLVMNVLMEHHKLRDSFVYAPTVVKH